MSSSSGEACCELLYPVTLLYLQWRVTDRPLDNDDNESEESRRSKDGSDWPASQDSASQSVDDDVAERMEDDGRQQYRQEVNEAKRAKLREIEVPLILLLHYYCWATSQYHVE